MHAYSLRATSLLSRSQNKYILFPATERIHAAKFHGYDYYGGDIYIFNFIEVLLHKILVLCFFTGSKMRVSMVITIITTINLGIIGMSWLVLNISVCNQNAPPLLSKSMSSFPIILH